MTPRGGLLSTRNACGRSTSGRRNASSAITSWHGLAAAPVPRGAVVAITLDSETEPVTVRLVEWLSNTKSRRDKLTAEQLDPLVKLGADRAG